MTLLLTMINVMFNEVCLLGKSLSGKLNSWSHKYISFGGRIILLNSVLNSLPIFYLSFLKMPVQVCKKEGC